MNRRHKHRNRRGGFTLIQLVALMFVVASLMSLSAVVLSKAYQVHSSSLMHLKNARCLQQASDRYRRDLHRAIRVSGERELKVQHSDANSVVYRTETDELIREAFSNGQRIGEERWQLQRPFEIAISIDRNGELDLCRLTIEFLEEETPGTESETLVWASRIGLPELVGDVGVTE